MKFKEVSYLTVYRLCTLNLHLGCVQGRTKLMGRESAAGVRRRRARDVKETEAAEKEEVEKEKDLSEEDTKIDISPR